MSEMIETPADIQAIKPKTRYTGKVVKTTLAGALVDIGLQKPGVVHISNLGKEGIKRVEDAVQVGQEVQVWVRRVNEKNGLLELTMVEPLGLEWRELKEGMVVKGKVVKLEKFGVFIDIGAERPGLAHISELSHEYVKTAEDAVKVGEEVEVKILGVDRKKKQIKLSLKALKEPPVKPQKEERAKPKAKVVEEVIEEEEEEDDTPAPTAMELALRKAMADTPEQPKQEPPAKETPAAPPSKKTKEREDLLARTLENRVKSG